MFIDIIENMKPNQKITIDSFVSEIDRIGSLDLAISKMNNEHMQFYSDNERAINKMLKKRGLLESYGHPEDPGYVGQAKTSEFKFKTIKYKGDLITLEWDPSLATWQPTVRFRSITKALRYGKEMIDEIDTF